MLADLPKTPSSHLVPWINLEASWNGWQAKCSWSLSYGQWNGWAIFLQLCPFHSKIPWTASQAGSGRQPPWNICWVLWHLCHHRMINTWGPPSVITLFLAANQVTETYRHLIHIYWVKTVHQWSNVSSVVLWLYESILRTGRTCGCKCEFLPLWALFVS